MTTPIGGPGSNMLANQLAQKNAQDARLLAKDSAKGANLNATTIARQSSPQADTKKATENIAPKPPVRETPKESFVSSTPDESRSPAETATRGQAGVRGEETAVRSETEANRQIGGESQPQTGKSVEALGNFMESMSNLKETDEAEFKSIMSEGMSIDTSQLPGLGESGMEVALASVALRTAVGKLQAKMPNATPEQIREAAKNDPEIAKWASIADKSQGFLSEFRAENPGVVNAAANQQAAAMSGAGAAVPGAEGAGAASVPGGPTATDAAQKMNQQMQEMNGLQRMSAETQAQIFADNMKTMESIKTIYQQMWAEMQKARAERHKLVMDTANSVNSIMMELHVNRARTSQKMFTDMLNTLTGNYR